MDRVNDLPHRKFSNISYGNDKNKLTNKLRRLSGLGTMMARSSTKQMAGRYLAYLKNITNPSRGPGCLDIDKKVLISNFI